MGDSKVTDLFDAFDHALAKLCAAFNIPCTNERRAAFRQAFGKIHVAGWERLVDHCLGEHGPEKFPTVKQLWGIRNDMRAAPAHAAAAKEPEAFWDPWLVQANQRLLRHILKNSMPKTYLKPEAVATLVSYKNIWFALMKTLADERNEVDGKDQRELWESHMAQADREIAV